MVLARLRSVLVCGADGRSCRGCWPSCSAGSLSARGCRVSNSSIITQALTYALMLAFFRNEMGFGGNNGLTDFKDVLGYLLHADSTRIAHLCCRRWRWPVAIWPAAGWSRPGWAGCWPRSAMLRRSHPFSRLPGGTGQSADFHLLSDAGRDQAGALYVLQVGIINPGEFSPLNLIEAVIWVAVGGRGALVGAVVGAVLANYAKTWLTGASLPKSGCLPWRTVCGVTLFLPAGLSGCCGDGGDGMSELISILMARDYGLHMLAGRSARHPAVSGRGQRQFRRLQGH